MPIIILLILSCYKTNFNFKSTYKTNFPYELTEALDKKDEEKVINILKEYEKNGKLYQIRGTVEELNSTMHMYVLEHWKGHTFFFDRLVEETLPANKDYIVKEGYYGGNILHYIISRANSSTLDIFLEKLKRNSISLFELIEKVVNLKTFQFMAPFKHLKEDILLTPLMLAIQINDIEMVQILLNNKANPNETQLTKGISALIFATIHGRKEIVQLLLDNGADFTHITLDKTHEDKAVKNLNAIMWAAKSSQREIIDLLIAYDRRGVVRKYYRNELIKKRLMQSLALIAKVVTSIVAGQLKANVNVDLEGNFDLTTVEKFIKDALEEMKKFKEDGTWLKYYPYFEEQEDVNYYLKNFSKLSRKMDEIKEEYEEKQKTIPLEEDKRGFRFDEKTILYRKCLKLKDKLVETMNYHNEIKNHIESLTRNFENNRRSFSYRRDIEKIRIECEKFILESKERKAEFENFLVNPNAIEKDINEEYYHLSLEGLSFSPKGLVSNRKNFQHLNLKNIEGNLRNHYNNRKRFEEFKIVILKTLNYRNLLKELQSNYRGCFISSEEDIKYAIDKGLLDENKKYWIKKNNNLFHYYLDGKIINCLGIENDVHGVLIKK